MDDLHRDSAAALIDKARATGRIPVVKSFFDEPTFTATHVVHDPATRKASKSRARAVGRCPCGKSRYQVPASDMSGRPLRCRRRVELKPQGADHLENRREFGIPER